MSVYKIKPGGMHDRALKARKKIQVIGGGFGNGKTALTCIKILQIAKDYPGCNILVGMATYAMLNDTIRKEFYKWVPPSSVARWPTISDNTMILKNKSVINFRYIQQKGKAAATDGATSSNLLSATYDVIAIDQIENPAITYKDWRDLMGRLRGTTPYKGTDPTMPATGPRWLIACANPSLGWFFNKVIKPYHIYKTTGEITDDLPIDSETGEPMIEVFEASTYENAHNLPDDFIKGMEATYSGQFRDRYIGGEWGAFEGLIYPMFDPAIHMVPRYEILQYLYSLSHRQMQPRMVAAFDYGIASPSCFILGFADHRGRVFGLDGFYKKEMTLDEIGSKMSLLIGQYSPLFENTSSILADPSIYKRNPTAGMGKGTDTIKDYLSQNYHLSFMPAHNDMINGIAKVATYLSIKDFPDFRHEFDRGFTEHKGGIIHFASEMAFIPNEASMYFWQMDTAGERIDVPIDRNDHAMDTIKYLLSYLPPANELLFRRA